MAINHNASLGDPEWTETVSVESYLLPWAAPVIEQKLADFLASAQESLTWGLYSCTLPAFYDGVEARGDAGVALSGIFDAIQSGNKVMRARLDGLYAKYGHANFAEGATWSGGILHLKGIVKDHRYVWSGSYNLSVSAKLQLNSVDIIDSPKRAAEYEKGIALLLAWIQQTQATRTVKVPPLALMPEVGIDLTDEVYRLALRHL